MSAGRYGAFIDQLRHDIQNIEPCCYQPELTGESQLIINLAQQLLRAVALSSERSGGWAEDGFSSPNTWLAFHTGETRGRARQVLRQAHHLAHMTHSRAAAQAGVLNETQVRLLTACRAKAQDSYDDNIDETLSGLDSITDLATACHTWIAAADAVDSPDPADLAPPEPEPSTLHLSQTFEGRWHLKGNLSPQDGQLLNQVLDTGIARYLQAKRDGDPGFEGLSIPALRAQTLADLAANALRHEPGDRSRSDRHHINLVLRLDPDGTFHPETSFPVEGLCDASFTRIVLGAQSEILDIGRATRTWPEPMGNAIRLRDRHCRFPHCHRPPGWCDIHHCTHWENGGPTSVNNGILLCRWHHTFLHSKRWQVRLDTSQQPIFTKPDGTAHQPQSCGPRREPSEPGDAAAAPSSLVCEAQQSPELSRCG